MEQLTLHTGEKSTSILIGWNLLERLEQYSDRKLILIVDENVYKQHAYKIEAYSCIIIPEGEKHKSLSYVEEVYRKLIAFEADRSSFIVGIGGGLVTDLAGFVASTYMRGLDFGFISSTMLGQVDASIGGKNGVNLDGYKNMVGVIRQPEFVWCDLDLLKTLDRHELVSGFAEVIKYGAIRDASLFQLLKSNYEEVLSLDKEVLEKVVSVSAAIKVQIVESDVSEKGDRKLLNFGHTLGHAIEKLSGMLHGYAVSIGMVMAAQLSVNLGYLSQNDADALKELLRSAALPVSTELGADEIFEVLLKDKKRTGDQIHFIFLNAIGDAFIKKIPLSELKEAVYDLY